MLAGDGLGVFECRWWDQGRAQRHYIDVADVRRFRLLEALGADREVELFAVPRPRRSVQFAGEASALWVRVEGSDQWGRLQRFRPSPTIILREGASSRANALWALDRPLTLGWARRGSERLSHALRAARKHADPDRFVVNPPGSCLREGRSRPVPVVTHACTDAFYTAREVVGALRDAPDPDAWRDRGSACREYHAA